MGIVERLRGRASVARSENTGTSLGHASHFDEAADRIEALEAENERLRGWLQHRGGPLCMARYYGDAKCDCGLSALIKEIEGD